jgi:hypothetical protein
MNEDKYRKQHEEEGSDGQIQDMAVHCLTK